MTRASWYDPTPEERLMVKEVIATDQQAIPLIDGGDALSTDVLGPDQ